MNIHQSTRTYAQQQDQTDPLRTFREQFLIPEKDGQPQLYFCGNSLGLQPKSAREAIEREMNVWQNHGVEGWFEGDQPWLYYHKYCKETLAEIVGAKPSEVCPMNNLTVNLHLMLTSFYQPKGDRTRILTVAGDFPSDQYALETHVRSRGLDPSEVILAVKPQEGEYTLQTEAILNAIRENERSLALVMMSGLHYYTGQVFNMKAIAAEAQKWGIRVGFDLAHAAGNAPLHLHDWGVDFAVWCSYKYLNSGPGGVSGSFVHEKNHDANLPRLAGWWGYDEDRRFEMTPGFVPMPGADGWQLSTPTILALAVHRASLAIFAEAGMRNLRNKSVKLTGYLEFLLKGINGEFDNPITIMTPTEPEARGCQLSLLVRKDGKKLFDDLTQNQIIGDWREPNCIRLAPTPLYNTFEEVWQVGEVIREFYQ
ncbi:kynureninase [Persicitalea jodogahamensis]|uniref:Kynureninase n=1 Tax=Persicitalea jodogahamensis TaxID=402147 RepID=A0A8J3GBN5_9BACT|nr:kynureninase [Persicitalea jodogahamensis]GHB78590.1 kynureninase [Persicitalea jodogahamensis]